MQCRMDKVMQAESQAVTCKQCKYTYWSPHESCKKNNHDLKWTKVTKKWFQESDDFLPKTVTYSWTSFSLDGLKIALSKYVMINFLIFDLLNWKL